MLKKTNLKEHIKNSNNRDPPSMNGFGQNITNITEKIMTDNFKSETTYTGYVEALNEK
jgi:hypothetical protein